MDIMRITNSLMRDVVGNILKKVIKSKLGYNVSVDIHELEIAVGENAKVHLDVDLRCSSSELERMLTYANLIENERKAPK